MGTRMRMIDDLDRFIQLRDYQNAYESWVAHIGNYEWALDLGRFGSFGFPGISDLDTIVIVDSGHLRAAMAAHDSWVKQSDSRQFLFFHPPVFVPYELVGQFHRLHSLQNLHWEGALGAKSFSKCEESCQSSLTVVWALFLLPIAFRLCKTQNGGSLRKILLVLKNLHTAEDRLSLLLNYTQGERVQVTEDLRQSAYQKKIDFRSLQKLLYRELEGSLSNISKLLTQIDGQDNRTNITALDKTRLLPYGLLYYHITRGHNCPWSILAQIYASRHCSENEILTLRRYREACHHANDVFAKERVRSSTVSPLGISPTLHPWQAAPTVGKFLVRDVLGVLLNNGHHVHGDK